MKNKLFESSRISKLMGTLNQEGRVTTIKGLLEYDKYQDDIKRIRNDGNMKTRNSMFWSSHKPPYDYIKKQNRKYYSNWEKIFYLFLIGGIFLILILTF